MGRISGQWKAERSIETENHGQLKFRVPIRVPTENVDISVSRYGATRIYIIVYIRPSRSPSHPHRSLSHGRVQPSRIGPLDGASGVLGGGKGEVRPEA